MTPEGIKTAAAYLIAMDAPYGNTWNEAKALLYAEALANIPDAVAVPLIKRLAVTRPMRPAPSEILDEIAKRTDPAPPLSEAVAQIRGHLFGYGDKASPHGAVLALIDAMGGAKAIGMMDTETFSGRAARVYEKCVERHIERVKETIAFGDTGLPGLSLTTDTGGKPVVLPRRAAPAALTGVSMTGIESAVSGDFFKCSFCGSVADHPVRVAGDGSEVYECITCKQELLRVKPDCERFAREGVEGSAGPS